MPLSSPKGIKVSVNAADIDLEISILVKAEACTGRALLVVCSDVFIDSCLNAGPDKIDAIRIL